MNIVLPVKKFIPSVTVCTTKTYNVIHFTVCVYFTTYCNLVFGGLKPMGIYVYGKVYTYVYVQ